MSTYNLSMVRKHRSALIGIVYHVYYGGFPLVRIVLDV